MDIQQIEKRSLAPAKWANLVMGLCGIAAAILSNASALMLDGLFSGVNFLAAVFAARVAESVQRKPDAMRPFGYEIDEAMYVMFRSLVLVGIILLAGLGAVGKIIDYASGEALPEIQLNWILAYMMFMLLICLSMAAWHHKNWIKSERKSALLKTERSAAVIDGELSAAEGSAFLAIALLKETRLDFLVPISDAIVILALVIYMIPKPIRMFRKAIKEVVSESVDASVAKELRRAITAALGQRAFSLLEVAATQTGRMLFAVAYIRPDKPCSVKALDELRQKVQQAVSAAFDQVKTEIIYTGIQPFDSLPVTPTASCATDR
jgi:predicted Co/Zn/Cd cation transporter (cation efflux family)